MSNGPGVFVNFVVIACWVGAISEEMNARVFLLHKLQSIPLIPPCWKYVKRDLSSNRIRESQILEFFLQHLHELLPHIGLLVLFEEVEPLLVGAFLPIGLTLISPVLSSMKVPLSVTVSYRLIGISRSAIYLRQKFTNFFNFCSPSHSTTDLVCVSLPDS